MLLAPSRRGFLRSLAAAFAAAPLTSPAEVLELFRSPKQTYLSLAQITREAVKLWKNSNEFLKQIDKQYANSSHAGAKVGQTIRIRLPADFTVRETFPLALNRQGQSDAGC